MSHLENHLGAFHALDRAWQGGNHIQQPRSAQFTSVFYATATIGGNQGIQDLAPIRAAADVGARLAIQGLSLVQRLQRCVTVGGTNLSGAGLIRQRGRAFIRIATSLAKCSTVDSAPAPVASQGFCARGRGRGIVIG